MAVIIFESCQVLHALVVANVLDLFSTLRNVVLLLN